jgi:hypothetical protein
MPVHEMMKATLLIAYINQLYRVNRRYFAANPVNTFTYQALKAVEDISIINVAEALVKVQEVGVEISKKADAIKHRHAVSHPFTVKWRSKDMQIFHDKDRKYVDIKAVIVWDIYRTVTNKLRKLGNDNLYEDFSITKEMAGLVLLVMDNTMKCIDKNTEFVEQMLESLSTFKVKFMDFVVRNPAVQKTK